MRFSSSASHRHSRAFRGAAVAAIAALVVASAVLAACGDDDGAGGGGGDDVTTTNAEPPGSSAPLPDLPINEDPSAVRCTGDPQGTFDANAVVGDPIAAAKRAASEQGCEIRVAVRNGEGLALTQDFRPDRVNVAVESGKVTEILNIG